MRKSGPQPNLARGAKSRANLRRGGPGRPKKSAEEKARDKEIRRISRSLLLNKKYQKNLRERLNSGRIQPGVEVALYYYAFGKPVEVIEDKRPTPVRITHEYSE